MFCICIYFTVSILFFGALNIHTVSVSVLGFEVEFKYADVSMVCEFGSDVSQAGIIKDIIL